MTVVSRRMKQKAITSLARGRECQIRLVGVCNYNSETVVPCHFRMTGLSGMGYIPEALFVAWGCSACHARVDADKSPEVQLDFAKGVLRTQAALLKMGCINYQLTDGN